MNRSSYNTKRVAKNQRNLRSLESAVEILIKLFLDKEAGFKKQSYF